MFEFFEVGGCVRDDLMGLSTKDIDFSVVAKRTFSSIENAFEAMENHLIFQGFKIKVRKPEFLTLRAEVPKNHIIRNRTNFADFVLARKDGPHSDGRRPDWVLPGSLEDDLLRRDFTVNALARNLNGKIIDIVGGQNDLKNRILRFVGNPKDRIMEDGLRVLRAIRFEITKNLKMDSETEIAVKSEFAAEMLLKIDTNRTREELNKMFGNDTQKTMMVLSQLPEHTMKAIFRNGLHLQATTKKVK